MLDETVKEFSNISNSTIEIQEELRRWLTVNLSELPTLEKHCVFIHSLSTKELLPLMAQMFGEAVIRRCAERRKAEEKT